ncbi:MAG: YajQ family cyclic di-GMP-binding protein [Syntrophaceae bacterium]|nr:YajQ family cyclic di-GMP-binding protein [Syntrophaceae bacterium]
MAQFSFDIVSEVDLQEVDNAVNQAKKEMSQRYDFKNSRASIEYNRKERTITLTADDDYKMEALVDILAGRFARRKVSMRFLSFSEPQKAFEGYIRQVGTISQGIDKDRARELVKIIKDLKIKKVQAAIENDKVRVTSPVKDDLQAVITHLRDINFPIPLAFCNYR